MHCLQAVDPNLISSPALVRAGRTGAARFAELSVEHTYVILGDDPVIVAMIANESRSPLNIGTATAGARLLRERDPTQTLHHTGVLDSSHSLHLGALRAIFQDCLPCHLHGSWFLSDFMSKIDTPRKIVI